MKENKEDIMMIIFWIIGAVMLFVAPIWAPLFWGVPAGWTVGNSIANIIERYEDKNKGK